jgi:uncharacterized protein (DUF1778 family)
MDERPERTAWFPSVRVYPWERGVLERAARLEGVNVSEYVRGVLVAAARRRVAKDGQAG